jgi:hypothetical protein
MVMQTINLGANPGDGTGDPLRVAFTKINSNFTELYSNVAVLSATPIISVPNSSIGKIGDKVGLSTIDQNYIYYCIANYDGITQIWQRSALSGATW